MHKYRLIEKKGEGTFSEVLKCQNIESGNYYACKLMKQHFSSYEQVKNLREIQCMRRLSPHANIVDLKEVIFDRQNGTLALIIELLDMNLYEFIKGQKCLLSEPKCQLYIYQVLKALDYMHRNGIFHRDIKPENILMKNDIVKLADFGSCRSINSKQPYTEYISTRWYRAPECLLTDGWYTFKMDIWSVGCVFAEILSTHPLFPGTNEVDQINKIHSVLGTPSVEVLSKFKKSRHIDFQFPTSIGCGINVKLYSLSKKASTMIELLCRYDPDDRPTAKQVLRHKYFKQLRDEDKHKRAILNVSHNQYQHSKERSEGDQTFMDPNVVNANLIILSPLVTKKTLHLTKSSPNTTKNTCNSHCLKNVQASGFPPILNKVETSKVQKQQNRAVLTTNYLFPSLNLLYHPRKH